MHFINKHKEQQKKPFSCELGDHQNRVPQEQKLLSGQGLLLGNNNGTFCDRPLSKVIK